MILSIRKLACAIAAAYVTPPETVESPRQPAPAGSWPCPSSCSKSASRKCRPPGCEGLGGAAIVRNSPTRPAARVPGSEGRAGLVDAASARDARATSSPVRPTATSRCGARPSRSRKDAGGAWTGAAQGFARKSGVDVDDLQEGAKDPPKPERTLPPLRQEDGGTRRQRGPARRDRRPLRGLSFPKRMSWDAWLDDGKGAFPFGRPVRWLVAMLDGTVVPFVIYGLVDGAKGKARVGQRSGDGGPSLPAEGGGRRLQSFRNLGKLREGLRDFVLLDPRSARRSTPSWRSWRRVGAPHDHGLVREWRDLVEFPTVLSGARSRRSSMPSTRSAGDRARPSPEIHPPRGRLAGTCTRFAAVTNTDGASGARRSCAEWSGWSSLGSATRLLLSAKTGNGRLGERTSTSRESRSIGPRQLQGQGRAGGAARARGSRRGSARREGASHSARSATRLAKADLPPSWCASSRSCRG